MSGPAREAVVLPELDHPQPIPVAVWVGNLLFSSPIGPRREDGTIPAALDEQLEVTFENLCRILDAAGASRDGVGMVNVQLRDRAAREAFNRGWVAFFPDEPRPARQVTETALPDGVHVLLTVTAVR
jgi:2-iminobutanoate/2-iminopropanoate deaminase